MSARRAEPGWSAAVRRRIAGTRLVVIGIGPAPMAGFAACGAEVVATVSVVPCGGPGPREPETDGGLVLTVTSATRDILRHVVAGYAEAIGEPANGVAAFLDRVDPDRSALVVSYLPFPHAVLAGRVAWTADSLVANRLERKSEAAEMLARVVSTIPSEPLPPGPPHSWWTEVCARLGATRLVVQSAGLSGGGTGTFVCDSPEQVPRAGTFRVAPFLLGRPGNVMGVVDEHGTTVVLPASRQLVHIDEHGRPLYAGNVTGERWAIEARPVIQTDVRSIGTALAGQGFFGPFGVDFIDTPDGRHLYHDLNPRMNGVTDSLDRLLAGTDPASLVPLVPLLLSRTAWNPDEARELEAAMHDAVAARPLARLWLTRPVDRPTTITAVPPAGTWTVDPCSGLVAFTGGDDLGGSSVVLQPTVPAPVDLEAGDVLVLGNLYSDPAWADQLDANLGGGASATLIDAFLA